MAKEGFAFPWDSSETADRIRAAIVHYWAYRTAAMAAQLEKGQTDAGTRGEVTAGKHLDAFVRVVREVCGAAGFEASEINSSGKLQVPGFFRPQKNWDVVIIRGGVLLAALEFKSQVGSFGNNINNRSEEALGNASDFWVSFREGSFGSRRPWLGYFMLVEEHPTTMRPVRLGKSPLGVRPEFAGTSYMDRYRILCQRMVLDGQYSAAALVAAPKGEAGEYHDPAPDLSPFVFLNSLFGHLIGAV